MIWKHKKRGRATHIDSLIGSQSEVTGDLLFEGGLHVDGTLRGNVKSRDSEQSVIVISEEGCVVGDVRSPYMRINGTVQGNVYGSEQVELLPKARITGDVYYSRLEMAIGAKVNGGLIHRPDGVEPEPPRELPAPEQVPEEVVVAEDDSSTDAR